MKKYLKDEEIAKILGIKPSTISHHRCTRQKQWSDSMPMSRTHYKKGVLNDKRSMFL